MCSMERGPFDNLVLVIVESGGNCVSNEKRADSAVTFGGSTIQPQTGLQRQRKSFSAIRVGINITRCLSHVIRR
jgi:hypothetical protein